MSTEVTWQTSSDSSAATEKLGKQLGKSLKGGEVIELASDLGGGKTTFTRGLAQGVGSTDQVASPTFTLSKVYEAGALQIHHFDFYRLAEAGIMADELAEVLGDPHIVTVVEWGDIMQHVLPAKRLSIHIAQTPEGDRTLTLTAPHSLAYLVEAVQG